MKVTVALVTYNHAPYIAQAIESVLMQEASFDFELLIGEDDSPDGTRRIISDYHARHPGRIRLFLNDRKDVLYVNGRPTGLRNLANILRNSRGAYIALLDGDDYWTSPLKLQRQVDYLENNRDCALCFHNVRILDETDPERQELHYTRPMREKYGIEDLLGGNFMHTCSVMFRSRLFGDFPPWFFECAMGDWPLHVLNAQHGRIGYLDEVMAVYRKHGQGVWSGQSRLRVLLNSIYSAGVMRAGVPARQARYLEDAMVNWYKEAIQLCVSGGNRLEAGKLAATYLKSFPFRRHTPRWRLLTLVARAKLSKASRVAR